MNCTNLKSVTTPNMMESIGDYAFANTAIESFDMPSGSFGNNVFYNCNLKSLKLGFRFKNIPDNFMRTNIGSKKYNNYYTLQQLTLAEGVESIGSYAFENCGLSNVTIPNTVNDLGNYAFRNNVSLKSVTFGSGLSFIYASTFEGVDNVKDVYFKGYTPPTIQDLIYWKCTIHVPAASINLYQQNYRNTFINCTIYDYVVL